MNKYRTIIGKFFDNIKDAKKEIKEKKKWFKGDWIILEIDGGYLVVSEKQIL